jgi:serine/threonine protein kinase
MLNEVKALTCICRSKATITLNEDYDHRRDHLVQYYGSYDSPYTNNTCLVLEYLSGSSLQNMITSGKAFSEEEVLAIAYSVLCAMSRITELKFIHRDIKVSSLIPFVVQPTFLMYSQSCVTAIQHSGRCSRACQADGLRQCLQLGLQARLQGRGECSLGHSQIHVPRDNFIKGL